MLSGGKAGLVSIDILRKEQEENRRRDKNNQPLEGFFCLLPFYPARFKGHVSSATSLVQIYCVSTEMIRFCHFFSDLIRRIPQRPDCVPRQKW